MTVTRVTIIDDDRDVLDVLREILEEDGHAVATFDDALPGIRQLVRSRPDLIIVDLELDPHREQLTGLQLIHAARSSRPLRNVPIIVSSADVLGLRDAWPELVERGDIHQLEKPFDLITLARVMATALGRPSAAHALDAGGTISAEDARSEHEA